MRRRKRNRSQAPQRRNGGWLAPMLLSVAALVAAGAAGAAYRPSPAPAARRRLPSRRRHRAQPRGTPDGGLLYTNTRTGDLRQLSPPLAPGRSHSGPAYLVAGPVRGRITVEGAGLTLRDRWSHPHRPPVWSSSARPSRSPARACAWPGRWLVSPATAGRHPAIAIVHGSEAGDRDYYDMLVNFYTFGSATSSSPTTSAASARRRASTRSSRASGTSTTWPATRSGRCAFSPLERTSMRAASGSPARARPAGSSRGRRRGRRSSTSPWSRPGRPCPSGSRASTRDITGGGTSNPTRAQIEEQLTDAQPSGFDPRPDLEKLSIPTLWLFGSEDKSVYTPQSVEILKALPARRRSRSSRARATSCWTRRTA